MGCGGAHRSRSRETKAHRFLSPRATAASSVQWHGAGMYIPLYHTATRTHYTDSVSHSASHAAHWFGMQHEEKFGHMDERLEVINAITARVEQNFESDAETAALLQVRAIFQCRPI